MHASRMPPKRADDMLSLIGIAASRVVGLVPWAGPRTMLAILYACLIVMAVGGPSMAVWMHMRGQMTNLELKINAEWAAKLSAAESEYARLASEAAMDAASVVVPDTSTDVMRMCGKSNACRDRGDTAR